MRQRPLKKSKLLMNCQNYQLLLTPGGEIFHLLVFNTTSNKTSMAAQHNYFIA
jgi:hypothetical protein